MHLLMVIFNSGQQLCRLGMGKICKCEFNFLSHVWKCMLYPAVAVSVQRGRSAASLLSRARLQAHVGCRVWEFLEVKQGALSGVSPQKVLVA